MSLFRSSSDVVDILECGCECVYGKFIVCEEKVKFIPGDVVLCETHKDCYPSEILFNEERWLEAQQYDSERQLSEEVEFGKYKGCPFRDVLQDEEYIQWVMSQSRFSNKRLLKLLYKYYSPQPTCTK